MTTVRDVCNSLKAIAPLHLAEDWDNVGLLLGDELAEIRRVMTCLTLTGDVADEAVANGVGLVVTHHPVLFKAVKKITGENAEGRMLLNLIRNGIAVYSPHTAWDNCSTGINQQLAEMLELDDVKPLRLRAAAEQVKLVTFVPEADLERVRRAVWDAGAGQIGNYSRCSFNLRGTGTFFGSESTKPAVGMAGQLEQVDEVRVEIICETKFLEKALTALRLAHPYEEPAVDVFSVKALPDGSGSGRMGTLPQPLTLDALTRLVAKRLRQSHIQFVGQPSRVISRVGIACGAAAEFLRDARHGDCQAFITGEARFHACLEAEESEVGIVLPGHYATERFAMENLSKRLADPFPDVVFFASERERDPLQTTAVKDHPA
jgi:dinuclear metal center YbgI/SA1388 family protein